MRTYASENIFLKDIARETVFKGDSINFSNFKVSVYTLTKPVTGFSKFSKKILAIPTFFSTVTFLMPWHLLQSLFHGLPEAIHGNNFHLKKYVFTILRDIQGCIGRILLIFDEKNGLSLILLSTNYKKYYNFCAYFNSRFIGSAENSHANTTKAKTETNKNIHWKTPQELENIKNIDSKTIDIIINILKLDYENKEHKVNGSYSKDKTKELLCKILNLEKDSSDQVIKKNYYKTMLLIHPDKLKSDLNSIKDAVQIFNDLYQKFRLCEL